MNSGMIVKAKHAGTVTHADAERIIIQLGRSCASSWA